MPRILESFSHIGQIEQKVSEEVRIDIVYVILLTLSCVIATTGILANNSAVVIGSMLISPMMWPILGMVFFSTIGKWHFVSRPFLTTLCSSIWVVVVSGLLGLLLGFNPEFLNAEVSSRITPTSLDLFVALATGFLAALVISWKKISDVAAGVALSISLLPPLCVVGLGLAKWDMTIISGSLLLFGTNILSIICSGLFIFLLLGFRRIDKEHPFTFPISAIISIVLLGILCIPLTFTYIERLDQDKYDNQLSSTAAHYSYILGEDIRIRSARVANRHASPKRVELQVYSTRQLTPNLQLEKKTSYENILEESMGENLSFTFLAVPSVGTYTQRNEAEELSEQDKQRQALQDVVVQTMNKYATGALLEALTWDMDRTGSVAIHIKAPNKPDSEFSYQLYTALKNMIPNKNVQIQLTLEQVETLSSGDTLYQEYIVEKIDTFIQTLGKNILPNLSAFLIDHEVSIHGGSPNITLLIGVSDTYYAQIIRKMILESIQSTYTFPVNTTIRFIESKDL